MLSRITRDVLDSFLLCKHKAHRKLTGQMGIPCDYQTVLDHRGEQFHHEIIERLAASAAQQGLVVTTEILGQGHEILLLPTLEDESFSIGYDALQKVAGGSKLGNFHYVPVLFGDPHHRHRRQRRILEIQALLLAGVQGRLPAHGLLRGAGSGRAATVRLGADLREAQRMLEELRRMQAGGPEPALVLNEQCAVCEFRRECREAAMRTDNLSLLRGMHPKEIARYNRKGILTVTQLALTFRPRRKGKRAPPNHRHNHALQAVAIRDHRIYVLGTPQLPNRPVRIYLDVESNPEAGYAYLIGLIVVDDGEERRYSFWAAAKDQEPQIFEQFLAWSNSEPIRWHSRQRDANH